MEMSEKEISKCVFCKKSRHEDSSELVYEDEEYIAFKDIKPATSHHYLVIPKKHIRNASKLTYQDLPLVNRLIEIGHQITEDLGADKSDLRLGFHWPPFNTVHHLHLHVISRTAELSFIGRCIFRPNSKWFVNVDSVIENLEKAKATETMLT